MIVIINVAYDTDNTRCLAVGQTRKRCFHIKRLCQKAKPCYYIIVAGKKQNKIDCVKV